MSSNAWQMPSNGSSKPGEDHSPKLRFVPPVTSSVMPPLTKATLIALLFISINTAFASEVSPRIVFDAAPDPGVPAEAIRAQRSASSERAPVSKVVHENTDSVNVRYFSPQVFHDPAHLERYLRRLLALRNGFTTRIIHWAEGLGIPSIEATVRISDSIGRIGRGRLLVWPGRAAYQDSQGIWWFTSWAPEVEHHLLER